MHPVARTDFGDLVGHPRSASDAVDESLGALQHPVQYTFGRRHLPQYVHVDAAFAIGALVGYTRLLYPSGDRIGNEFFMSLASRSSVVDLRDRLAGLGVAVGVDPGESADATSGGPGSRAFAIRHRDALAPFDERQHLTPGNHEGIERFHRTAPCREAPTGFNSAAAGRHVALSAAAERIWGTSENTEVTPQPNSVLALPGSLTV